jgi:DNA (cytosine-5)-methyltransferase 1
MSALWKKLSKVNDYPAFLDQAWNDHLAPKPADAPTVISTFAGCGGSSLGYSMAGFRELLANEWDANAADTFRLNFPDVPVIKGDIAELSVEHVLEVAGLEPGELSVFDGSPPCQGFSTSGKRELTDNRNQLFREYTRLLRGLMPKTFVMENVSGMGKMKIIFAEIMRDLRASGYKVSARLINTKYFGVPQARDRVIFIGVRNDLDMEPTHPTAETVPVTVQEAITGVVDNDFTTPRSYSQWSSRLLPGQSVQDIHPKGFGFNMRKAAWNKPSFTITKTHTPAVGILHPAEDRFFSISELKRLGSFPDQFVFSELGANTPFMVRQVKWSRIGNSVPPLFMRAIARHIRQEILERA